MAERRMFAKSIIDSDMFLSMPLSAQALYFHLAMRADDDGFIDSPRGIQRTVNCSDDDFRLLTAKQFVIPFESGVVVIRHWRLHNYIQKDRYKPTLYAEEKQMLSTNSNRVYDLTPPMKARGGGLPPVPVNASENGNSFKDEDFAEIIREWEKSSGKFVTARIKEEVEEFLREYKKESIISAIHSAAEHEAVNLAYVKAILKSDRYRVKQPVATRGGGINYGKFQDLYDKITGENIEEGKNE